MGRRIPTDDEPATQRVTDRRSTPRVPTEVTVTAWPYASSRDVADADGVMYNFSNDGAYIETSHDFKPGTIITIRVDSHVPLKPYGANSIKPRSICLAEVKWQKELMKGKSNRYGMGIKYLYQEW